MNFLRLSFRTQTNTMIKSLPMAGEMSQLVACLLGKHINPSLYTYQPGKNLNVAVSAYNEGTDGERQGERQREGEMNP